MKYVVVERQGRGSFWHDPSAYLAALPDLRTSLPAGAQAFACDSDHYEFSSPRCVKDLKLGALPPTRFPSPGFEMRLLCCRGVSEHGLTLRYTKVAQMDVVTDDGEPFALSDYNSLRLDEILPHEIGCSHELRFTAATIRIVCADLTAHWDPLPQPH
ncbi:hypothetical protein LO771_23855 [Streptacidiphilus sp. ASG 303]|uniref:hypothetical protein n=1 Tax=Streptacidiphilus sp. ASG 303 TaxID=2896847 RepID=UPI001E434216|nr:hypothetical protein [Streptacidiphilus sp. ASG 303]MCD0485338.1 hypothetical protein [Streptacidiphilus sp. ASG 303]